MRLFITFILGMMLFSGPSQAQEDNVATATTALQNVLSTLKQSVEKLSLDNDQLAARDNAMKNQLLQLQKQLQHLESQGDLLDKAAAPLRDNNTRRAEQISHLEEENYDLDNRTQKAEVSIKSIQQSMASGYQEDQKLLLQLKGMQNILPVSSEGQSVESQAQARLQKEKLKLMKMIYESQQRQEALHESILGFHKDIPLLPAAGALAHQQLLKEQIKDMQAKLNAFVPEKSSANYGLADQWDDAQLHQLEMELKVLDKNYLQLKNLVELMSTKAQSSRMTVSERVEEGKLQGSIDDLRNKEEGLKAALVDLRSQMVDLDKRKTRLEEMIKQMP